MKSLVTNWWREVWNIWSNIVQMSITDIMDEIILLCTNTFYGYAYVKQSEWASFSILVRVRNVCRSLQPVSIYRQETRTSTNERAVAAARRALPLSFHRREFNRNSINSTPTYRFAKYSRGIMACYSILQKVAGERERSDVESLMGDPKRSNQPPYIPANI